MVESAIHVAADGKRYLVVHGDAVDVVVRHARWLALLGDWAYETALVVNAYVNWIRRSLGLTCWSLSQWAKLHVKDAVKLISDYESALAAEAKRERVDGIICGHIHHAAMRLVESCTAVVETYEGDLRIIQWGDKTRLGQLLTAVPIRASVVGQS